MKSTIRLSRLYLDPAIQSRIRIDEALVAEYAEQIQAGAEFPPIVIFHDAKSDKYLVADGFHRTMATQKCKKRPTISCIIKTPPEHQAARMAATIFAATSNADHGLRRTNADKRRAIANLLDYPAYQQCSDRAIAKLVGVDHKTVAEVRRNVGNSPPKPKSVGPAGVTRKEAEKQAAALEDQRHQTADAPEAAGYLCQNPKCGHNECDEDGACTKCKDPGPPATRTKPAQAEAVEHGGPFSVGAVPIKFMDVFGQQHNFRSLVKKLGENLAAIEHLRNTTAGTFLAERFEAIKTDIGNAQRALKFSMPHDVCGYCQGKGCKRTGSDKTPCREGGWVAKGMKGVTDEV